MLYDFISSIELASLLLQNWFWKWGHQKLRVKNKIFRGTVRINCHSTLCAWSLRKVSIIKNFWVTVTKELEKFCVLKRWNLMNLWISAHERWHTVSKIVFFVSERYLTLAKKPSKLSLSLFFAGYSSDFGDFQGYWLLIYSKLCRQKTLWVHNKI